MELDNKCVFFNNKLTNVYKINYREDKIHTYFIISSSSYVKVEKKYGQVNWNNKRKEISIKSHLCEKRIDIKWILFDGKKDLSAVALLLNNMYFILLIGYCNTQYKTLLHSFITCCLGISIII